MIATAYKKFDPALFANYLLIAYAFFLPISHKMASILMIFIVLFVLFSGNLKERFMSVVRDNIIIAFLLVYFMHLVWMIGSEHIDTALFKLKEFKYLLYIIPIAMILKKEFIPKILGAFVMAMFFSTALSYAMHFGLALPFDVFRTNVPSNPHQYNVPFMESYTQYSTVLSIAIGIALYQLLRHHGMNIYARVLYASFFITASLNLFILGSRIGYLLYALSIFVVLTWAFKKQFIKITLAGFLIALTGYITAYTTSELFHKRSIAAVNDIRMVMEGNLVSSLGARIGYYIYSYDEINEHWLFGVGTGDHVAAVNQQIQLHETDPRNVSGLISNINSGHNASLHSEYLDTFVQFGLIGLLLFLNLFYQIYRYPKRDDFLKMIQLLMISIMLFVSLGSIIFISADIGKIFVLLIALTLNISFTTLASSRHST